MENTKGLIQSWTFWFGLAQIALAIAGYFSGNMGETEALTLATTGMASIGLRLKTTQPIGSVR